LIKKGKIMPRGVYNRKKKTGISAEEATALLEAGGRELRDQPVRLMVTVPYNGVVLKMLHGQSTNPNHVAGTLEISKTGIKYIRSNGKKRPEKELRWLLLEQLMNVKY